MIMDEIINKVAQSSLVSLDLEDFYPKNPRIIYDIQQNLWQGIALKEKDFREFLKTHDWTQYQDKFVAINCSVDAIIPTWAYMLLALHLNPVAKMVVFGNEIDLENAIFKDILQKNINPKDFQGKKVVIKGCSKLPVPISAYIEICNLLQLYAQSIMFGEPCSTVPLFKAKKGL